MLTGLPYAPFLAAAVALAPAVLRLWWGRPLVRLADDPALPERLVAHQARNTQVVAAAVAILLVSWPSSTTWAIPLLVAARGVAAYPLRKQLYTETWGLAGYLSFFGRLVLGLFGFWLLLAALPLLAQAAGTRDWIAALVLAAVLFFWNARAAHVLRWLLRVRPIADVVLLSRFQAMVAAAGIPSPRFDYVDLRGGVLANALAVPSARDAGVIFTDTLLARLETEEIVAICAHELAHLEHFNPSRLRRLGIAGFVLIAAGAALAPLTRLYVPGAQPLLTGAVWMIALAAFMMWRARDRQKNETASDLRAVELCGDADALVRALTKLHTFARVPRRWDLQRERQATHPSLARRLRDIRAAVGTIVQSVDAPTRFAAPDGPTAVTFDRAHVIWQEGTAATHSFSYSHLTELRLDARPSGLPRLVAIEATGRRWEMTVGAHDVAALQAVLDLVDGGLTRPVSVPRVTPMVAHLFGLLAALVGLVTAQFAFAVVALLAVLRPVAPLLAAAGVGAIIAAALVLRDSHTVISTSSAATLALLGITLLSLGWWHRREAPRRSLALPMLILATLSALACAMLLSHGLNPVRLYQASRTMHAAPVTLLAFATGLAFRRGRVSRYLAALAAAPALLAIAAGSTTFLERLGRDPFFVRAQPLAFEALAGSPLSELEVRFDVGDLRLSPHGASIAASPSENDDSTEEVSMFHIGPATGPLIAVRADDLAFVDDSRLLIMSAGDNGADVRAIRADDPKTDTWRVHVDEVRSGALSVNAATGRWQILGWDRSRRIVRAQGRLGDASVDVTHWNGFATNGAWVNATATSRTTLLAVDKRYDRGIFGSAMLRSWYLPILPMRNESWVWRVTPEVQSHISTSLLDTDCTANVVDDQLLCTAYDGRRTGILRIDAATATPIPVGSVDGRFIAYGSRSPGWLTGWLDSTPAALRVTTREAIRVDGFPRPISLAAGEDVIGTVSYGAGGSVIRVYRR